MKRESRWFTLFLASMTMLTSVSIDMSLPAVPRIETVFGVVAGHGALTLSVFLAGYAVTPLIGGPLADRFGRRPVFLIAIALFSLFSFGCAVATGFRFLLVFRLLQGCVSGIVVALPLAIVRDLFEGHAARQRVSEITLINGIMPIVAPLFGAAVMPVGGWRAIFVVQGVFAALVGLFAVFEFEESKAREAHERFRVGQIVRNYALVFSNRTFVTFAFIYALNFACIFSFVSTSPLVLMERMQISRSSYTLMFGATLVGTVLGSSASGAFSKRRYSIRKTIFHGLVVMTAASGIAMVLQMAKVRSPLALLVPTFVVFFCFGLTSPILTLEALGPFPRLAGSGSGAIRALQMGVGSIASSGLAILCALPMVDPGLLTTITMTAATAVGLLLFAGFARKHPAH